MLKRSLIARPRFLIPFILFVCVVGFLGFGLRLDSTLVPSPLVGKEAPTFELPILHLDSASFGPEQLRGKAWLLNVWASWCVACHDEHPILVDLANRGVMIIGLNYKDKSEDATKWLLDYGNPYLLTAVDQVGEVAIDWGVYGVPETFLIDSAGVIRFKHIGPLTPNVVEEELLPLLRELS